MYPIVKASLVTSEEGFTYTLNNEQVEIQSDLRVPKCLRRGGPFRWAGRRCELTIPHKNLSILRVHRGYEWDGVSIFEEVMEKGLPIEVLQRLNQRTLVATLHHDAIYEALRERAIGSNPEDWEKTYKWADRVQLEILKNRGKLTTDERIIWAYHLAQAKGAAARPPAG